MRDLYSVWGCGKGILNLAQPHVRIMGGFVLGSACLLIPSDSMLSLMFLICSATLWLVCAAMPLKMAVQLFMAGVILFGPYLLLTPWIVTDSSLSTDLLPRLYHTSFLVIRSICMLFISVSTVSVLPLNDMHTALIQLPIPRWLGMLVVQLVNQTMFLLDETRRIVDVLLLRGVKGFQGLNVITAFPVVWMIRILFRAQRTADAMAVRGYGIEHGVKPEKRVMAGADIVLLIATGALFFTALLLRLGKVE